MTEQPNYSSTFKETNDMVILGCSVMLKYKEITKSQLRKYIMNIVPVASSYSQI